MKLTSLIASSALVSLLASGASAEQYQGVLPFHSTASRAEVKAGAVIAAHSPDLFRDYPDSTSELTSGLARSNAHAQAVSAAQAGNLYGDWLSAGVIPGTSSPTRRQAVKAQARLTSSHGLAGGAL